MSNGDLDASRDEKRAGSTGLARVRALIGRFAREKSGSYAAVFALSAPFLIGGTGLATEGGLWLYERHVVQNAADTAALSAATAYGTNKMTDLTTQAEAVVSGYPFMTSANGASVSVNNPPTQGSYAGNKNAVEVIVSMQQQRLLTALFSTSPLTITGRAVAKFGNSGNGCVLALNRIASAAVGAQGSTNVALNNCGIYDNSDSSSGLSAGGSAVITALSASVVGGVSGASNFSTTQGISTGVMPTTDPYASVSMPSFSGCNHNNLNEKNTVTLSPGVYCGGLQLNAGADVTLQPGTYFMDRGSLQVAGGATLTGNGVTIIFTSSTGSNYASATINGGASINLTAPTTGPLAGLVFFGDRNMPTSTTFKFNGGSGQVVNGAVYLPDGTVDYAGGASATAQCTQLIGDTVTFVGSSALAINCASYGTSAIGSAVASLVE
ncbi:MAG: hypothetical protein KGJ78_13245 [Alphaproteobacteria bacterium]|nr:hypothetical protein [Alphaproteobacteria bacterium]